MISLVNRGKSAEAARLLPDSLVELEEHQTLRLGRVNTHRFGEFR